MKPGKTSRRAFLSAGLILPVAGASARLGFGATTTGMLTPAEAPFEDAPTTVAKLPMRTLGRTGLKVNPLGFGCGYTPDPSHAWSQHARGCNRPFPYWFLHDGEQT